jgi:hypothetical protein
LIKDGAINHEAEMGLVKIPLERQNESLGEKEKILKLSCTFPKIQEE